MVVNKQYQFRPFLYGQTAYTVLNEFSDPSMKVSDIYRKLTT